MSRAWPLFDDRYRELIEDYDGFISSLDDVFPIGLRPNLKLTTLENFRGLARGSELKKLYSDFEFYHSQDERKFWGSKLEHHLGHYFIQALSSVIPLYAFDDLKAKKVVDLCAAPGGKSTLLAELIGQDGLLVCNEPSISRRRILKANIERMGHSHCAVTGYDATTSFLEKGSFDAVLLDGPCSSEGTFRTELFKGKKGRSENFITYNKSFRNSLHRVQRELILRAFDLLKVGGTLIYSTCTYDPDENEGNVQYLLDNRSEAKVDEIKFNDEKLMAALCPGVLSWGEAEFDKSLTKTVRLYPHRINSIGFYFAKISRRS